MNHFLLLRHQLHASPLYTSKRTFENNPLTTPWRGSAGGAGAGSDDLARQQAASEALYGARSRAAQQDPFTAVPLYSQRFVKEERALPDWSRRPVCRELFPRELLEVVEPEAVRGKRRKLELSRVSALPSAEEAFGLNVDYGEDGVNGNHQGNEAGRKNLLDRLAAMGDGDGDGAADKGEDEEGAAGEEAEEDLEYDDSDAGDYDAENYFDNGDEYGDDYDGGGDDGEGTF